MIRSPRPSFDLRYRLVQTAVDQGIRAASRIFNCSRNTVRKWLRCYQEEGKPGLQERSRALGRIPHKTPPALEQMVLQARDAIPCFGPHRLKQEFDLPCSTGAIGRILRQHGRSRRRKKPRPPVRSLAAVKMQGPAFSLVQVDVKDLKDLAGYRELIPFGLPRFQFTARMVPEGTLWLAFSAVNDSTYALLFADRLLAHLARCGVDLSQLVVQTDNGSEFGSNWNRRHGLPAFTRLVEQKYGWRQHRFNPPHRSTYNSDVERVHGIMEPEFYELERFSGSASAFLRQAYSYQLYFNLLRRNSAKRGQTPEQLRPAGAPTVSPQIYLLPPVMLSSLSAQDLPLPRQILGHDVPGYVTSGTGEMLCQAGEFRIAVSPFGDLTVLWLAISMHAKAIRNHDVNSSERGYRQTRFQDGRQQGRQEQRGVRWGRYERAGRV
jgi:transposase